jgi:hypothetical protein
VDSAETQTRHPNAVMNHLNFFMMTTSVAWIYASRLEKTPSRRHVIKGRNHFAFSDVRRLVAKAVMDDNFGILYQEHAEFDSLQAEGKHFVTRIKANTTRTVVRKYDVNTDSIVFYDAEVLLGIPQSNNQTQKPVRLVGYRIANVDYWVVTDRRDLTAEQIAEIYKLRWEIESFFAWWKRHLKVYHLIARSQYGLMIQILGGLITYLLLAIYCHKNHGERVSIKRVRQLRIQIQNELRDSGSSPESHFFKEQKHSRLHAKT